MHKSRPQEAATAHWPRHTPHCRQFTPHHRNLWFHTHQCYTVKPCSVAHMPLCCKSFPDLIEVFDACSTWNFGKRYSNWRRTYLGIGTFAKGRLNLVLMYWNMLLHLYRSDASDQSLPDLRSAKESIGRQLNKQIFLHNTKAGPAPNIYISSQHK